MVKSHSVNPIHIIGGGLAGSEAAWQAMHIGVPVIMHEMRGVRGTDAHQTDSLAELVCSNSFRSDDWHNNAVGLLHEEMRRCGSLIMACADEHQVPAGGALAVDRDGFSAAVTARLQDHPLFTLVREEIDGLPPADWDNVIIAAGPLASPALSQAVHDLSGEDSLAFYDAIAPIIHVDSINMDVAWKQSRYDKPGPAGETAAYINCPLSEDQYNAFIDALLAADKTEFKEWETPEGKDKTPYFEACLPVEVMAARGRETLRFGPLKPVGLTNPHPGTDKPYAVVQLRQDNALGTLFNMVGFQTKMKYGAQTEVLRMIPGLEDAQFARLGGIHRNTFLNSPKLLNGQLQMTAMPRLRFAGQITGVEGYVESAAIGLLAGRFAASERLDRDMPTPPNTTALGGLLTHITGGHMDGGKGSFQPMNINYGLLPPMEAPKKDQDGNRLRGKDRTRAKKQLMSARALDAHQGWEDEYTSKITAYNLPV